VLAISPYHPDALHLLGLVSSQQGDYLTAVELMRQALTIHPNSELFLNNLGTALIALGRLDEAETAYRQALDANPMHVQTLSNLGSLLKDQGKLNDAVDCFTKALDVEPGLAPLHNNLGNVLTDLGRPLDAVVCFRKALALKGDYAKAYHNMASAFRAMRRYEEAVEGYCNALRVDAGYAEAHNSLGETLAEAGKPGEAIRHYRTSLDLNPNLGVAVGNLLYASRQMCTWHQLDELQQRLDADTLRAIETGERPPEDPFLNLVRHDDPAMNLAVARGWSATVKHRVAMHGGRYSFAGRSTSDRKLVIGYLSSNFHDHPMAHLMVRLINLHDRRRFTINCYSCGEDDGSEHRHRIKQECDEFVDLRELTHTQAADRLFEDQVDILVDLMGHTKGHRMEISALRPAPLQARYLGMAGTTGAECFDYLIADRVVVPPGHFPYYTEKIVHLPYCYQANDDQQHAADGEIRRSQVGLPEEGFVFCSFNQPYKIDPAIYGVWMSVLRDTPHSVLWLQGGDGDVARNLRREAEAVGVDGSRIIFAARVKKADHLARLKLADLGLDTRLVSGAATTSDALWAGVPVVTLEGSHFSSRMSASILRAIGLPELVTESVEQYHRLAVVLATDVGRRANLGDKLARNVASEPLFDTRLFARAIEQAYRDMWALYSSGDRPRPIAVEP
jgi:protein O-GlcNAc transferase